MDNPLLFSKISKFIIGFILIALTSCSLLRQNTNPDFDARYECKRFTDSLISREAYPILVYHKHHGMFGDDYFIFWMDQELEVRRINPRGILKPSSWELAGLYRNDRIFQFFLQHQNTLQQDSIPTSNLSHYPYSNINIYYQDLTTKLHLPFGVGRSEDSSPYHLARLIESIIFNIEQYSYWKETKKE